jgi:aromatic ring-opening dioxygenase catalytic subunit (LigB family)
LRVYGDPRVREPSAEFDRWLVHAAEAPGAERAKLLADWQAAPFARLCHPREEHLLPLMVMAGAAGSDRGRVAFRDTFGGCHVSAVHFGG